MNDIVTLDDNGFFDSALLPGVRMVFDVDVPIKTGRHAGRRGLVLRKIGGHIHVVSENGGDVDVGVSKRLSDAILHGIDKDGVLPSCESIGQDRALLHGERRDGESATIRAALTASGRPQKLSWPIRLAWEGARAFLDLDDGA